MRLCITRAFLLSLVSAGSLLMSTAAVAADDAKPLVLHARRQVKAGETLTVQGTTLEWKPKQTAVVVCDMWDSHHCKNAASRVGEMAPHMNDVINILRDRGVLVIHCPSDTMGFYKDAPGRKLAQSAPPVETKIPLQRWCSLDKEREAALPIDDSDGGCDTDEAEQKAWEAQLKAAGLNPGRPWTRQHAAIEIKDGDAITDSAEAYYLMRQRGITNVIVMGVHTNMCVLGRPFSIRQMIYQGQNVVLVRDMTDTMYNPKKRPFVSHFEGTRLVIAHIEEYWCPTITSSDFTGKDAFRFKGDVEQKEAK